MKTLLVLIAALLLLPAGDPVHGRDDEQGSAAVRGHRLAGAIPPRPPVAIGGSEFGRRTIGSSDEQRQRMATVELLAGNVPDFLRDLLPIEMVDSEASGSAVSSLVVWVMPDYVAIGSDEDFLRIPLTRPSIAAISTAFDMAIPTTRIADAAYLAADLPCRPLPMTPGPKMRSSTYYLEHQKMIQEQTAGRRPGDLVAGNKKDIVLSTRLVSRPDRIAIYGWHRGFGDPIQPLSTIHGARYADYSHGVRLIDTVVLVEGEERSLWEVLADPELAPLLSDEGVIDNARSLVNGRPDAVRSATGR